MRNLLLDKDRMNNLKDAKIYSITISVSDIELVSTWYEKKLGFERLSSEPTIVFNSKILFLGLKNFHIELIENISSIKTKSEPPPMHTKVQGFTNFCLLIEDLGVIKQELEANEVPIVWQSNSAELGVQMLLISDPDNNLIQYLEHSETK